MIHSAADVIDAQVRFIECEECHRDRECNRLSIGGHSIDLCEECQGKLHDALDWLSDGGDEPENWR